MLPQLPIFRIQTKEVYHWRGSLIINQAESVFWMLYRSWSRQVIWVDKLVVLLQWQMAKRLVQKFVSVLLHLVDIFLLMSNEYGFSGTDVYSSYASIWFLILFGYFICSFFCQYSMFFRRWSILLFVWLIFLMSHLIFTLFLWTIKSGSPQPVVQGNLPLFSQCLFQGNIYLKAHSLWWGAFFSLCLTLGLFCPQEITMEFSLQFFDSLESTCSRTLYRPRFLFFCHAPSKGPYSCNPNLTARYVV